MTPRCLHCRMVLTDLYCIYIQYKKNPILTLLQPNGDETAHTGICRQKRPHIREYANKKRPHIRVYADKKDSTYKYMPTKKTAYKDMPTKRLPIRVYCMPTKRPPIRVYAYKKDCICWQKRLPIWVYAEKRPHIRVYANKKDCTYEYMPTKRPHLRVYVDKMT